MAREDFLDRHSCRRQRHSFEHSAAPASCQVHCGWSTAGPGLVCCHASRQERNRWQRACSQDLSVSFQAARAGVAPGAAESRTLATPLQSVEVSREHSSSWPVAHCHGVLGRIQARRFNAGTRWHKQARAHFSHGAALDLSIAGRPCAPAWSRLGAPGLARRERSCREGARRFAQRWPQGCADHRLWRSRALRRAHRTAVDVASGRLPAVLLPRAQARPPLRRPGRRLGRGLPRHGAGERQGYPHEAELWRRRFGLLHL
mmetsp:Transcript_86358/g.247818  ORF Transcript_86358/g.247818 Transcript_86358/m.247818 type:complete len:259 (+) Transcript_86358:847-1623(+)